MRVRLTRGVPSAGAFSSLATAAVACSALAPASAFAIEYMTAEAAQRLMFPDADHFEPRTLTLDATQLQQLDASGVRARSARWSWVEARHGGTVLGYVVTDAVVGKFELIDYAVGLDAEGRVKQVEVLAYRESHGQEIRLPAWRRQFIGKGSDAPLRVGNDIANISGATLSCNHVTDGVRRIVTVFGVAHRQGLLA